MDGEPPQEEDFSQIPLVERSQHKNWKARLSAYTDVIAKSAKTASDTDPFFRPFLSDGGLLKKWCLDSNVVAQEKGIEAVLAIVQYSGETSAKIRPEVVPAIVDKALGSARAGTKKKGIDLCAMFVEVENGGEGVIEDVMAGLNAKLPKAVAGSVTCIKEIIETFGVPALGNIKPLLKSLSKIFGHSDKNVRAEGTTLTLVLYTYLGPALLPALADLKPVQMSELQKSFDSMDAEGKGAGTGKATRYTRKVQRDREAAEASGGADEEIEGGEEEVAAPIDPKSLLDPVDVLALFPSDLMDRLASSKWKDRLESLEECTKVLVQPQNASISDSNVDSYGPLAQTLGTKCKSDANINVVIEASKVIEGIAKGMGRPFGRHRGVIMPGMMDRLKERKVNVTDALGRALDAIFSTTTFSDIVEDVLNNLKSKNPQVKEGTLKFLLRSLQTTTEAPGKDQIKPIAETLVVLLGDSAEPVRTNAAECLGTMMKILGERVFNPFIEGVGELQMAKVKDAFGRAEIKYKAGGAAMPAVKVGGAPKPPGTAPPKPAASGSPPIKASGKFNTDELLDDFSAPPAKAPPARFARPGAAKPAPSASAPPASPKPPSTSTIKRPPPSAAAGPSKPAAKPAAKPPAAASSSKAGPSKTLATSPSEPVKYRYSPEEAAAIASDVIPADYHVKLADGAWKVRLEAAEEMVKWVGEEDGAGKVDCEVMMRFLGKTPGWGEKNFQVSGKLYQVMGIMAEKSPSFGKPAAALVIGHLTDKLGDMKLKKPAGDTLTTFAEKTSLAFVLAQGYEPMTKQKAPKAQADALTWIKQQLIDFGIAGIPLRDLIGFVKNALGSPNALVRKSATEVLVTVRIAVGADISGFLEDLNPQLLNTINSEFEKVSSSTPPEPTKTQADLQESTQSEAGGAGKAGKGGADPLDDLIPRQDLDKLVASTSVIQDAKSDAWKTRKEAFEALNAVLEVKSNNRLKPNMGEIGGVLKKAMADTNLSVKMLALSIISKIATGMGQPFDKYHKLLVAPVASVCADQKAPTRSAALATLSAMADATGGLDHMFSGLGSSLESTNPVLRATVLGWLAARIKEEPPSPNADLSPLAGPIITCLEDRNGDVRKGATAVLPFVVASAGFDFVMDQTSKLKPASKATIVPLISNARSSVPTSSSAPAPKATTAAPSRGAATPVASRVAKSSAALRSAPGSPAPSAVPSLPKPSAVPARSMAMKALSSVPSSRPMSSLSQGDDRPSGLPKSRMALPRPASSASHAPSIASSSAAAFSKVIPFIHHDPAPRTTRLKRDATRWVLDPSPKASSDLSEYLQHQIEPQISPELFSLLFSKDHRVEEDYMAGLSTMSDFYDVNAASSFGLEDDEVQGIQLANVDLALKYAALKLLGNNTQLANRCLELMSNIVELMPRYNERFSDGEAKLFVPALVFKLGDAKFGPKLAPIFESLDKVIAGSQVVALLVQYGLEDKSAGKTCKNESLALIEKAYKKRGSILRTREDRGFYETIAKCISDSGTRNAALSVMALLQLQGESKSLAAVIEAMPNSSKDMLANRRSTMAASRSGIPNPLVAKVSHDSIPESSPRLKRPTGLASPRVNHLPRETASDSPRGAPSPASRLPRSGTDSPSHNRAIPAPSGLPRPAGIPAPAQIPSAATSRLARPAGDVFGAPNGRSAALQPLARPPPPRSSGPDVIKAINEIRHDDLDRCVDALKVIQHMLTSTPELFIDNVETLSDTLMDEMEFAFTPPENLHEPKYFRVVKHLIQSFSGLSSNQDLMKRLSYTQLYSVLNCLSLRLVQADKLGGSIQDMSRFFNLVLVQCLSTPDRLLVFKVMFKLLLDLTQNFSVERIKPDNERANHPDLVIKCLWKRCKILDDDFRSNRLKPGPLLAVLEEFLQGVGPSEYRRRAAEGIALGDMPLRTVKTIIQKMLVYTQEAGLEVYDILLNQFGDDAASTIVYTYVFRLAGRETAKPAKTPLTSVSEHDRPTSAASQHTATSLRSERPSSSTTPTLENALAVEREETEAERLVKNLRSENQAKSLDGLYAFIKSRPDAEDEVNAAIAAHLTPTFQTYVRRMIEQRKNNDNPSPIRGGVTSPIRSPSRPESMPPSLKPLPNASRKSIGGPRPSSLAINVDKNLPLDDQLAQYKNLFRNQASLNHSNSNSRDGSSSPPPALGDGKENEEVVGEIPVQGLDNGIRAPRASDVD
uniref:Microtubule Associated protein n=1 Tax=Kwoniella bestiolae CBS 10118 TaxID=1296100 RepID=A0A1B9FYN9_9TREE|nr:microtubule Associated protein [Kwoniella bestiolae CBS 10118]OCF23887.1 microtubule Associated protein [Kwoniella bestiolae CBS 10118]